MILFACADTEVFYEYKSLPDATWDKDNTLTFEVLLTDTIQPLDVFIEVRNNDQYPFQNLWLFVDCKSPQGIVTKDTVNISLADVYGTWQGEGLSIYTLEHPYQQNHLFPDSGIYRYSIRQGMRVDQLSGVSDVGLKFRN
jgi:gliding motility-associated lipoprotein GldH